MASVNTTQEALLDELLKDWSSPQDILGEPGVLKQLTNGVVERGLEAERTAPLGYAPHARHETEAKNARNGQGQKTLQTDPGPGALAVPRDRHGRFAPQRVPKPQRRLEGFDDKGLSRYARGRSTREMQGHLDALYGPAGAPALRATSTDAVLEAGRTWQARPLASVSPLRYFAALCVKARQEGPVQTKAVSLALGVTMDGGKARLGMGLSERAGAQLWLRVCTELQNRGGQDGFSAGVAGLPGLPEAMEAVLPKPPVQRCMGHKVRHTLTYGPWKERGAVAAALRAL
jgi:putative transposase